MESVKMRIDIDPPTPRSKRYDFDKLRPGASWHVETNAERLRILSAFKYWASNIKRVPARATSLKVDATDPDGPGYRIWFVSTRPQPAPAPQQPEASAEDI